MTKNNLSKNLAWLITNQGSLLPQHLEYLQLETPTSIDPEPISLGRDARNNDSEEDMARLRLAPQSNVKPRLLAQPERTPRQIISFSPPQHSASVAAASPTRGKVAAPNQTDAAASFIATPSHDLKSMLEDNIFDIDDLDDLLDQPMQDSAAIRNTGDTVFYPSVSANTLPSRLETPPIQKNRKRKSEDITQDGPVSSPSRKNQQLYHSEFGSDYYEKTQNYDADRRLDNSRRGKTTSMVNTNDESELELCNGEKASKNGAFSNKIVVAMSPDFSNEKKGSSRKLERAVVPDSDEDSDEVVPIMAPQRPHPQLNSASAAKSSQVRRSPIKVIESPSSQVTGRDTSASAHTVVHNNHLQSIRQNSVPNSSPGPSRSSNPLASSNSSSNTCHTLLIDRFLASPPGYLNKLLAHLDQRRQILSQQMADQWMESNMVSQGLTEAMHTNKSRIVALHEIAKLKDEYEKLCTRRRDLKIELHDLIEQDRDFGQTHAELQQLKLRITPLETRINALILESGWFEQHNGDEQTTPDMATDDDVIEFPQNVLVASTQRIPHQRPILAPQPTDNKFSDNEGSLGSRDVPTPVPFFDTAYGNRTRPVEYQGKNGYSKNSSQLKTWDIQRSPERSKIFSSGNPESHSLYARNMGSPDLVAADADDFGDFFSDDDVKLLDDAQACDDGFGGHKYSRTPAQSVRPPLSLVSGNARQGPSRQDGQPPLIPTTQYAWTKDVTTALRKRFNLQGFRHNQLEAINATLGGKDAFVLMPTGGGKSLCYQLPSVIQSGKTQGVTVVISPLLSLMQDQVDHLQKLQIQAHMINGESTREHKNHIFQALRDHHPEKFIQLLYITPEMIGKSQAMIEALETAHRRKKFARLVIDEAHCVSQWGHDFRPDYKALGDLRQTFRGVPIMALTATATENVKIDVIHNLSMDGCEVFNQSFNRPNLSYEVREKLKGTKVLESIADTINTHHRGQSGIVYCLSRKNCEDVAKQLQTFSIRAAHYHAGMKSEERTHIQKQWQAGNYDVIVATIAFGMGIDKPNVRFVIHHTIPKSLEGYYQETGRAGRDGLPSQCYLYYGFGDTTSLRRMIKSNKDASWQQIERQLQMLRNVVQYCENKSDCRRLQVLAYFNEHFDRSQCHDTCDNCRSDAVFENVDFTDQASDVITLVRDLDGFPATLLYCVDLYRGIGTKKVSNADHKNLGTYGKGQDLDRGDVERLFYRLIGEEALEEWNKINKAGFASQYVALGRRANEFESKRTKLELHVRASPGRKVQKKKAEKGTKRKANGTGVKAAVDYPASTNVSSPIESRKSRTKSKPQKAPVVFDKDSEDDEYFETDLAAFAPVRQAGVQENTRSRGLGPRITSDSALSSLSNPQKRVLEDFMGVAKRHFLGVVVEKGLKKTPVPDSVLREIGIKLPRTIADLAKIENLTSEKVQLYGQKLLDMVGTAHKTYQLLVEADCEGSTGATGARPLTISDDEDDMEDDEENFLDDDFDVEELEAAERSHYFNAQQSDTTLGQPVPESRSRSNVSKPKGNRKSGSQPFFENRAVGGNKSQRGYAYSKRNSGGKSGGISRGGKKSRTSGARSNGNATSNNDTNTKSRGATTSSRRGGGLIGMMPT